MLVVKKTGHVCYGVALKQWPLRLFDKLFIEGAVVTGDHASCIHGIYIFIPVYDKDRGRDGRNVTCISMEIKNGGQIPKEGEVKGFTVGVHCVL